MDPCTRSGSFPARSSVRSILGRMQQESDIGCIISYPRKRVKANLTSLRKVVRMLMPVHSGRFRPGKPLEI